MEISYFLFGFAVGCIYTYYVLYIPSMRLDRKYQERLENQIRNQ